jgi:hypothetical protein
MYINTISLNIYINTISLNMYINTISLNMYINTILINEKTIIVSRQQDMTGVDSLVLK